MTLAETNTSSTWKRSKTIAILLAVFFGPWTWLYTFRKDAWKASAGLGSNLSILIFTINLSVITQRSKDDSGLAIIAPLFMSIILFFTTWILSIVDTTIKKREWYNTIENHHRKAMSATYLALFLGPWAWLYTFFKDRWKFYISIILGFVLPTVGVAIDYFILVAIGAFATVTIWLFSIIEACVRKEKWYQSYPI
jgi:hypothetical protein